MVEIGTGRIFIRIQILFGPVHTPIEIDKCVYLSKGFALFMFKIHIFQGLVQFLVLDLISTGNLFYSPLELWSGLKKKKRPIWSKEGEGLVAFQNPIVEVGLFGLEAAWFTLSSLQMNILFLARFQGQILYKNSKYIHKLQLFTHEYVYLCCYCLF